MPKPRLTFDQAKMKGSVAHNAGRFEKRKASPKPTGEIGAPPEYFRPEQKEVWKEIVAAIPYGVAGSADRFAIEMAAILLDQLRDTPLMQASRIAVLMNLLSRLGLDPQARTRLNAPEPEPESDNSPYSQFLQ
jgi:phage terminase small subunit